MSLVWSDVLATGSTEIDLQHKELFTRINRLLAAHEGQNVNNDEVSKVVQYLTDYVVFHFGTEEQLMDRYAYASASGHKAQHVQFVKVFQRLKERMFRDGMNPQLQQEMRDLVVDWLQSHIKFSDRALGAHLRLKGHHG